MSPLRGTIPGLYLAPSDFVPDWKPGESYGPRALIDTMQQSNGMDHRIPECGSALSIVNSHCAVEDRSLLATRFNYVLGRSTVEYSTELGIALWSQGIRVLTNRRSDEWDIRWPKCVCCSPSKLKSINSTFCEFPFHRCVYTGYA